MKSSDLVAYEDLQITNLVKNHRLAKSISDASWGLFLSSVRYYGTIADVPSSRSRPGSPRRIALAVASA